MIYVGIDPGLSGAIAIINQDKNIIHLIDTPVMATTKKGGKTKNDYLPYEMTVILKGLDSPHVFIESVHAMPGQGSTSMFRFGFGCGLWEGIIAALALPLTKVTPQAWKKELMAGMKDKDAARIRAQELFPQCVEQLFRKKDCGRADALLIAEYGRRLTR
jgi:crossover junction endodeoxyribonuclease RuvC